LAWDPERRYAMVGLENGHILFYFISTTYEEFSIVREEKYHKDRVSKLIYNKELDLLISVSHDYTLAVYDMVKEMVVASTKTGKSWLGSVTIDADRWNIYTGCYNGDILVYNLNNNFLTLAHVIKGHEGSVRCLSYIKDRQIVISGGFDHSVAIWNIPGPPTSARSAAWLKGGPKARVIDAVLMPSLNQVAIAYGGGYIGIWDHISCQMWYALKAHNEETRALQWFDGLRLLVSAGDSSVNFWQFPRKQPQVRNVEKEKKLESYVSFEKIG